MFYIYFTWKGALWKSNLIYIYIYIFIISGFFFQGCAVSNPKIVKPKITQQQITISPQNTLKRKVAIARFTNESGYGKSKVFGLNGYDVSKQGTDILSTELTKSGQFILLERSDSDKINQELKSHNIKSANIAADYLILGSINEFGRTTLSDVGVFSRSKTQKATAKVNIRIVDVKTGEIIFAQDGTGEALSESGSSFGLGKQVAYDATLNDKAISSAIASMIDQMIQNLTAKPWRSYVLSVKNDDIFIAGGKLQGIKIGDIFSVYKVGQTIKNPQTNIDMQLPGSKIATIKITSLFGDTYTNEGSVAKLVSGSIKGVKNDEIYIQK